MSPSPSGWRGAVLVGFPHLPLAAMAAGLLIPALASGAFAAMSVSVPCSILLGVLALPSLCGWRDMALGLCAAACGALLAPLLAGGLAWPLGLTDAERTVVMLAASGPLGGAAIVAVRQLGFAPGGLTATMVISSLAAPLTIPVTALCAGSVASPIDVAWRLTLMCFLPASLALAGRQLPLLRTSGARRHIGQASLLAVAATALARMDGVAAAAQSAPLETLRIAALTLLPALAGALALLPLWRRLTVAEAAVAGGMRNNGLVWAATTAMLPPQGQLFMALTAIANFGTPSALTAMARLARAVRDAAPSRHSHTPGSRSA